MAKLTNIAFFSSRRDPQSAVCVSLNSLLSPSLLPNDVLEEHGRDGHLELIAAISQLLQTLQINCCVFSFIIHIICWPHQ